MDIVVTVFSTLPYKMPEGKYLVRTAQLSRPRQLWSITGPSMVLLSRAWIAITTLMVKKEF